MVRHWDRLERWKTVLLIVIAIGVFFRFFNINEKVYWHDETINAGRVSGYSLGEAYAELPRDQAFSLQALKKYQYPSTDKSSLDVIQLLAQEEPQNPPLYYLIARLWYQVAGQSTTASRLLSAIIGVGAIPVVYLLGNELFTLPLVGLWAAAILAISPFHVLYAQEARPFSLWTVTTLLSTVLLVRACKTTQRRYWIGYGAVITAGLYTFPFTLFVILGHGLQVISHRSSRRLKTLIPFGLATALSLLLFSPWLWAIAKNSNKMDAWRAADTALSSLAKTWVGNLCRLVFDLNFDSNSPILYVLLPSLAVLALMAYALVFLVKTASKPSASWVIFLILVTAAALILPDVLLGGRRSSVSRYFIPSYVGLQVAIAYLLATKTTTKTTAKTSSRTLWNGIAMLVIGAGLLSNGASSQAQVWWTKPLSLDNPAIAQGINSAPTSPVLIIDTLTWQTLELSHSLRPDTQLFIPDQTTLGQMETLPASTFLFYPSPALLKRYQASSRYQLNPLENLKKHPIFKVSPG